MNLYQSLAAWADRHPEVIVPFGFQVKKTHVTASVEVDGGTVKVVSFDLAETTTSVKGEEVRSLGRKTLIAPAVEKRTSGAVAQLLTDQISYVVPHGQHLSHRDESRHESWTQRLLDAASATGVSELRYIAEAVSSDLFATAWAEFTDPGTRTASAVNEAGNAASSETGDEPGENDESGDGTGIAPGAGWKLTAGQFMNFVVNGQDPLLLPEVQDYWTQLRRQELQEDVCVVTGKRTLVARILQPVLIGGSLASLSSGNDPATFRYGRGGNGAPVAAIDAEVAHKALGALGHLASQRNSRRHFQDPSQPTSDTAKHTFVWWTDGDDEFDVAALFDSNEIVGDDMADALDAIYRPRPLATGDVRVHGATFGSRTGRHYVVDEFTSSATEMLASVRRWFAATAVVDRHGQERNLPLWKLGQATRVPLSKQNLNVRRSDALVKAVLPFVLGSEPMPPKTIVRPVINSILGHVNAGERPVNYGHLALLRLALFDPNHPNPEAHMVQLDPEHPSSAYHLGRYFAVAETIQRRGTPGLNRSLVDTHLGSMLRDPSRTFPRVEKSIQPHLSKLGRSNTGAAIALSQKLSEVAGQITEVPKNLSDAEQAEFVLGRHHQKAKDSQDAAQWAAQQEAETAATEAADDATPEAQGEQ